MGDGGAGVRQAETDELATVMGILDAAMLSVGASAVEAGIERGDVLVAVDADRVLGACVLEPVGTATHVDAIAVRPGRRGQGIATALVEAAAERAGRLTAAFDEPVRPFYESLGFEVRRGEDGRLRGVR